MQARQSPSGGEKIPEIGGRAADVKVSSEELKHYRELFERLSESDELVPIRENFRVIEYLAAESGNPPWLVLMSALGLFKLGLDAQREGNRLAVVDDEWEVLREITGIPDRAGRVVTTAESAIVP